MNHVVHKASGGKASSVVMAVLCDRYNGFRQDRVLLNEKQSVQAYPRSYISVNACKMDDVTIVVIVLQTILQLTFSRLHKTKQSVK